MKSYWVILTSSEKDKQPYSVSFVLAINQFSVETADGLLSFSGEVVESDKGLLLVKYHLSHMVPVNDGGSNAQQYRNSTIQSGAVIQMDHPLHIFAYGDREYALKITTLDTEK